MFGRLPFADINLDEKQVQYTEKLIKEEIKNVTIHFGEGKMNPSTIACILAKVEERLTEKQINLPPEKWGHNYFLKVMGNGKVDHRE